MTAELTMPDALASKYLLVSREIENRIRDGQWPAGRMPGVRELAGQHHVSVVTASRALQVLRDKGLIRTVNRSGCFLAADEPKSGEHFALCLRVTPGRFQRASDSVTRGGFAAAARTMGFTVDDGPFDFTGSATDRNVARQIRQAVDAGLRGLFLMPSRISDDEMRLDERVLSACRGAGLPVVLVERNLRGENRRIEYDLVGLDDVGGAAELTRHLLDRRCKRVAIVVASPISTHEARTAGYLAALFSAGASRYSPLVLHELTDRSSKAAFARLADELTDIKADGVVCYNDYLAVGLVLELLSRGLRVPKNLAVAGFDDLPIGSQFAVGITTYTLPAEEIARRAVQIMRQRIAEPEAPPVRVVVAGRLIVRESTGGP
jgi:LacI family transcriptional regulator